MNTKHLILVLAAIAPVGALAEPPAPIVTTMVNCSYAQWPSRAQVARNLRIPVVTVGEVEAKSPGLTMRASDAEETSEIGRLQQFIRRQGRYECAHGASHVQVDFHAPQGRRVAAVTLAGMVTGPARSGPGPQVTRGN